jgi:hypothetical protein
MAFSAPGASVTGSFAPVAVIPALWAVSSARVTPTTASASANVSADMAARNTCPGEVPMNGAAVATEVRNFAMIAVKAREPRATEPAATATCCDICARGRPIEISPE